MKERKLKIIIAMMTFAVLGLIGVQLYWITSIIKTQEEKFEASVNEALSDAIDKIELNETKNITLETLGENENRVFVWNNKPPRKIATKVNPFPDLNFDDLDDFEFDIKTDSGSFVSVKTRTRSDTSESEIVIADNKFDFTVISELDSMVSRKAKIVSNVVNQFIIKSLDRPIEERINAATLDSIIGFQLNQEGIETEYNFGVMKKNNNEFAILKDSIDLEGLKGSEFNAQLFPDELFGEPNFLFLYFPNQKSYLIQSVSIMLALSALLIITIIAVFFKTVQMLIKQKKITEIKNDLINNITHEFKTPISTISLACEALAEPNFAGDSSRITRYTGMIKEENSRLQMLIDSLLRNASVEKGEYQLKVERINLYEDIIKVSEKFKEIIESAGGSLNFQLNAENTFAELDRLHFNNILSNLLDNAYKYSDEKINITISTRNDDVNIFISIEDEGIGIDKQHQKKIFDTFYRVPKGNIHDVKGYGVGLSYVKIMTEAMGGTINVESKIGEGSKFTLTFPLSNYQT